MKRALVIVLAAYVGIATLLYISQEIFIFPILVSTNLDEDVKKSLATPPKGIQQFFAKTSDGEQINVWTSLKEGEKPKNVAIIFHGNAETVAKGNFLPFFRNQNIPAFTFDYRGYGISTGWPSEQGLYLDAEAVWNEIQLRTGIEAKDLIILGNSIGTGPASYLAQKINPKALILLAAFSDMPSVVSTMPLYAPFQFVLRYNFPVTEHLAKLKNTCVILAHGMKDKTIPFSHLTSIKNAVPKGRVLKVLESAEAVHNDIFYKVEDRLLIATQECLK